MADGFCCAVRLEFLPAKHFICGLGFWLIPSAGATHASVSITRVVAIMNDILLPAGGLMIRAAGKIRVINGLEKSLTIKPTESVLDRQKGGITLELI